MAAQDISHEAIIALVHARLELRDSECPGYANRMLKRSKWEEVYRYVTPNWDDMSATEQDNRELSQAFLQEQEKGVQVRHQKMMTLTQVKKPIQRQFHPKIINRSLKNLWYANLKRRVRSTSTTRRTCRTQQEPPFEEYFDCIIKAMKNQSQNMMNSSTSQTLLRMLLCVVREIPPDKHTEVRDDIHAYLMYIVSACKEQRPYPRFQPWGLGFNTPNGSFYKPMPSHQYHETTPAINPYAGPPPTYTPFPSHPGFQRMHLDYL
ncbi:hypothetical protein AB205_0107100 [Aquarana catesbeiana]|uniref:MADF domain-containing protein n=1 Tax=Aquarana catesbeiana TaxID=8400 RepID=A0A2G9PPR4_AQUCT|nr:hypothetical protein AB205_0107100 [Aquarana catesbeiana]